MRKLLSKLTFEHGVILIVALNLIDAISTHLALSMRIAYEINPLLRWAFSVDPGLFWIIKISLVTGGLLTVGKLASDKVAKSVVVSANILYTLVIAVHVYGWIAYFINR